MKILVLVNSDQCDEKFIDIKEKVLLCINSLIIIRFTNICAINDEYCFEKVLFNNLLLKQAVSHSASNYICFSLQI